MEIQGQRNFVAVPGDDGNVKLVPAEELRVVRMLDSKAVPSQSGNAALSIFWVLLLLAAIWFISGGWEKLSM